MDKSEGIKNSEGLEDFNEFSNIREIKKIRKELLETAIYTLWCGALFALMTLVHKRLPTSFANQYIQAPFATVGLAVGPSTRSVESSTSSLATELDSQLSNSTTIRETSLKTSLFSQISRVQRPLNLVPTQSCLTVLTETGKSIQRTHTNYESGPSLDVNRLIRNVRTENSVIVRNVPDQIFINKLIYENLVLRLRGGAVLGIRPAPAINPVRRMVARQVEARQIRRLAPVEAFPRLLRRPFVPQRARTNLPINNLLFPENNSMSFLAFMHRAQDLAARFIEGQALEAKRYDLFGSFENKRQASPFTLSIPLRYFDRGQRLNVFSNISWKEGGKRIGANIAKHPITQHMIVTPLQRNSAGWENLFFLTRPQLKTLGVDSQLIDLLVYKGKGHSNSDQLAIGLKKRWVRHGTKRKQVLFVFAGGNLNYKLPWHKFRTPLLTAMNNSIALMKPKPRIKAAYLYSVQTNTKTGQLQVLSAEEGHYGNRDTLKGLACRDAQNPVLPSCNITMRDATYGIGRTIQQNGHAQLAQNRLNCLTPISILKYQLFQGWDIILNGPDKDAYHAGMMSVNGLDMVLHSAQVHHRSSGAQMMSDRTLFCRQNNLVTSGLDLMAQQVCAFTAQGRQIFLTYQDQIFALDSNTLISVENQYRQQTNAMIGVVNSARNSCTAKSPSFEYFTKEMDFQAEFMRKLTRALNTQNLSPLILTDFSQHSPVNSVADFKNAQGQAMDNFDILTAFHGTSPFGTIQGDMKYI